MEEESGMAGFVLELAIEVSLLLLAHVLFLETGGVENLLGLGDVELV